VAAGVTRPVRRGLYIAARAPREGEVKTRLARGIGAAAAVTLYRAFVRDLAAEFPRAGWFVTPVSAWDEVAPLLPGRGFVSVLGQGDGDWTDRQRFLFATAPGRGDECTVLIGSDSPHLRRAVVDRAFAVLEHRDLVLGPTFDGGYYLIGMRGWHDVLAGVRMSTDRVLDGVLSAAGAAGVSVGLLEATFDVDEVADLGLLREELARRPGDGATASALERLARAGA
jgi:rSAM/selenodomain-associated transferase 1